MVDIGTSAAIACTGSTIAAIRIIFMKCRPSFDDPPLLVPIEYWRWLSAVLFEERRAGRTQKSQRLGRLGHRWRERRVDWVGGGGAGGRRLASPSPSLADNAGT